MDLKMHEFSEADSFLALPSNQKRMEDCTKWSEECEHFDEVYLSPPRRVPQKTWHRPCLLVAINFALITFYTSIFIYYHGFRYHFEYEGPESIVRSPASKVIRYHPEIFDSRLHIESRYSGEPSAAVDQAWADLVEDMHVRISGEDLRLINKTSIPLPDEEDTYWGTLGVNHEIHCLKRLREALYEDHYFLNLTPEEKKMNLMHSSHCIEVLRQAAQCRGDTSIVTMYWGDASPIPVADFDTPHACVDWQAIMDWQHERRFDPKKPGYLRHPTLGLAYPDGKGPKLGVGNH